MTTSSANAWPELTEWGGPQDLAVKFASSAATRALVSRAGQLRSPPPPSRIVQEPANTSQPIDLQLYDALAAAKIYTSQVAMHMDRVWRDKLFRQLDSLLDVEEWADGDVPLRKASFATFLKVMFLFRPGRRPGLGISSTGNLIGAWTDGTDQLTIECLPGDVARYVFSHEIDGRIERTAGETLVTRLTAVLEPYAIAEWLKRK